MSQSLEASSGKLSVKEPDVRCHRPYQSSPRLLSALATTPTLPFQKTATIEILVSQHVDCQGICSTRGKAKKCRERTSIESTF